jgi:hypothetical protein
VRGIEAPPGSVTVQRYVIVPSGGNPELILSPRAVLPDSGRMVLGRGFNIGHAPSDPSDLAAYEESLANVTIGAPKRGLPAKPIIDIVLEVPDSSQAREPRPRPR